MNDIIYHILSTTYNVVKFFIGLIRQVEWCREGLVALTLPV